MEFIGVDLGWHDKPSGLAHLRLTGSNAELLALTRRTGSANVLAWINDHFSRSAMIGIDAPLIIANAVGMRPVDRLMHNHFGKYHAGCYPANLGRPFSSLTTGVSQSLALRGFIHAIDIEQKAPGRYQIEVYPHAATVNLFNLQRILRYKKGRISERRAALKTYRDLLISRLSVLEPALVCHSLPDVPSGGSALKEFEDELDAIVCAYVAAHWWYWGTSRNKVFGDVQTGYIVVPNRCADASSDRQSKDAYAAHM